MMTTLQEIKNLVCHGRVESYYTRKPLLSIKLHHVIADELHLLLHITDVLLDNLVTEVIDLDYQDEFERLHLTYLVTFKKRN